MLREESCGIDVSLVDSAFSTSSNFFSICSEKWKNKNKIQLRLADSTLVFLFSVARKGMQSKVDLYNRQKKQNKQHMRTLLRLIKIKLKNCITPKITIRQVAVASFLI